MGPPWGVVEVWPSLPSTNITCAHDPRPWRVVTAEEQTAGRGRLDRSWTTIPGSSLAVSVLLPHEELAASGLPLGWVPLVAGVAVCRAVADTAGLATALKWPNDVLVPCAGDRKLAGILCQWVSEGVVVGMGVNVNTPEAELPLESATSVRAAGAGPVTREAVLGAYLNALAALVLGAAAAARTAYADLSATIGAEVEVTQGAGAAVRGRASGVDPDGRLIVETDKGALALAAGDVIHLRASRS